MMEAILTFVFFPVSRACTGFPRVSCFVTLAPRQVLMQIAANSRSFSLYAKLGFEVKGGSFSVAT